MLSLHCGSPREGRALSPTGLRGARGLVLPGSPPRLPQSTHPQTVAQTRGGR